MTRVLLLVATAALVVLTMLAPAASAGGGAREVTYRVAGDTLVPEPSRGADARLWKRFVALIPAESRAEVRRFTVFRSPLTDGFVVPLPRRSDLWELGLRRGLSNDPELDETIIHEFGHLLTLNAAQVPPHPRRGRPPKCWTFNTGEGCALPQSYIALYVAEFWRAPGTLADWRRVERIASQRRYERATRRFFQRHRSEFVSRYAATNPGEDIAESWTSFVLRGVPRRGPIAAGKHRFFERFPELVELRERIRATVDGGAHAPAG